MDPARRLRLATTVLARSGARFAMTSLGRGRPRLATTSVARRAEGAASGDAREERGSDAAPGRTRDPVWLLEADDPRLDAVATGLVGSFETVWVHAPRRREPRRFDGPRERGAWSVGGGAEVDPVSLGLVLEGLESLILTAPGGRPWVVGLGGGASVALAFAGLWGDRLSGLVALEGIASPLVPEPPTDLPVLRTPPPGPGARATWPTSADVVRWLADRCRVRAPGARVPDPTRG